MDGMYEHYPKLKSTSSYYCVRARGIVIINAQSNNLFLVIDGVRVVGRDNGGKPTDGEVSLAPSDKNIADKKAPVTAGGDSADKGLLAIIGEDTTDKKPPASGVGDIVDE